VNLGIDFRVTDFLAIGAMGEYSHTWTALDPRGHIDVDSGRGGLYATLFSNGFYLNSGIYGGHNNYDSGRSSFLGIANGSTEGEEWSTFVSGGYDFHFGHLTIGPTAAFAGIPGPAATFFVPSEGHDSAVVSAGVSVRFTPMISTYLYYDGQLGRGNYESNAVTGGVRINF